MTLTELDTTQTFYRSLLAAHGDTPAAVGWDASNQRRRFEVLTAGWNVQGASILDVGCGRGDLHAWLMERGFQGLYTGIDVVPEFVALANARTEGRCTVADAQTDPLPACDYLIATGVFNLDLGGGWQNPWWWDVLNRIWQAAGKGMAFDCLCTCRTPQDARQVYRDPTTLANVLFERFHCAVVRLTHNDPPGNLIVQLTKQEVANAIEKWNESGNDQQEHQRVTTQRTPSEAISSDCS